MFDKLQVLDPKIVEAFLVTRDATSVGIPASMAQYILELNAASNLHKKYTSITECAMKLKEEYPLLSLSACKTRIYDAINYLNANSTVTSEAWNLYYADQFEKLAQVCMVAHDFKQAHKCMESARRYRIEASANAIDPQRIKFKPQIVSPDIQLERMGIKSSGLLAAYNEINRIISERDMPDAEKKRLTNEASLELNITDVEHEDV